VFEKQKRERDLVTGLDGQEDDESMLKKITPQLRTTIFQLATA
jgi:hypothetical protein